MTIVQGAKHAAVAEIQHRLRNTQHWDQGGRSWNPLHSSGHSNLMAAEDSSN